VTKKSLSGENAEEMLAEDIAGFYADPLGHVMYSYPWDTDQSIQIVELKSPWKERFNCKYGPDKWACEFLDELGEEVKARGFDGKNGVDPIRFATASGHGIGKSVLVAWIIKWIMDTRPFCRGTVTAMTDVQLRTKTWAEVGKWHKMSATRHWFDYFSTRGSMALKHRDHPESWFCTAQTSREENSESFAGQHAANSTSFYVFDEGSGIAEKIYEVREGGLTDGEPMVFDFGNPTRNSGRFYENCVGRFKQRYIVRQIDSRDVEISSKSNLHKQWIADYGIDSDFVKVRVRGMFPSAGSTQFIPIADVETAMGRPPPPHIESWMPLVFGVDVARFGHNETVIYPRIGQDARSWEISRKRGLDNVQVAQLVVARIKEFKVLGKVCQAIFIDGGGVGGGVVDILRNAGYPVHDVLFGGKPIDGKSYKIRSDEMWGRMKQAIKDGLALPAIFDPSGQELRDQLTQREFGLTLSGNKISLESKEDMADRLGDHTASPDIADALALTFAMEIASEILGIRDTLGNQGLTAESEYDPLEAKH
jgi:hypothetical protein